MFASRVLTQEFAEIPGQAAIPHRLTWPYSGLPDEWIFAQRQEDEIGRFTSKWKGGLEQGQAVISCLVFEILISGEPQPDPTASTGDKPSVGTHSTSAYGQLRTFISTES